MLVLLTDIEKSGVSITYKEKMDPTQNSFLQRKFKWEKLDLVIHDTIIYLRVDFVVRIIALKIS